METDAKLETRDEVLSAAREAGFTPSDVQLKAWRRAGLLPRPVEQRGLGRERGSVTYYPPGTADQLLALCRLHTRERDLAPLAFLLWWQGYAVPLTVVRAALDGAVTDYARAVAGLVEGDELSVAGWDGLERLEADPRLPSVLTRMRKRVGRNKASTAGHFLLQTAAGGFRDWPEQAIGEEPDADIMTRALGLQLLRGFAAAFDVSGWGPDDPAQVMTILSAAVAPTALAGALRQATDAELEVARDELRAVAVMLDDLLVLLARTPALLAALAAQGKRQAIDASALLVAATVGEQLTAGWRMPSTRELVWLFLAGLALYRQPRVRQNIATIVAAGQSLHEVRILADQVLPSGGSDSMARRQRRQFRVDVDPEESR
jgi:hypothetical protein